MQHAPIGIHPTITIDHALATLIAQLARIARTTPDLAALREATRTVDAALGRLSDGLATADDISVRAHRAYLAALMLAKTLDRFAVEQPALGDSVSRFRGTTTRMLDTLERMPLTDADRSLRRALLG